MNNKRIQWLVIVFSISVVSTIWAQGRPFNSAYSGEFNNRIAFPIGGIGAGMYCVEGTGAISHMSVRGALHAFNEPLTFAAIAIKNKDGNIARVLEGPVPDWKIFGTPGTANGGGRRNYGLPHFRDSVFEPRFPFASIKLTDTRVPLQCSITVWSPFIPTDADNSSLPVGALEYRFTNPTGQTLEAVFSYHAGNFMAQGDGPKTIEPMKNGFILQQAGTEASPWDAGAFAVFADREATVDCCWFKGGWWDAVTIAWHNVQDMISVSNPPQGGAPGASLFVPLTIRPGESQTVRLLTAWYVPDSDMRYGATIEPAFGKTPATGAATSQQEVNGFLGKGLINTYSPGGDGQTGSLTSPSFKIDGKYIQFLLGGGDRKDDAYIELMVDDKSVARSTGKDRETLVWTSWNVTEYAGKMATIRIVDEAAGNWGHINVDHIIMTNQPAADGGADLKAEGVILLADFEDSYGQWTAQGPQTTCSDPANCTNGECQPVETYYSPWYAGKFANITEVTNYWRANYDNLRQASQLFCDTFYDTTLPVEVVEAVAANLTILKTPTVLRQKDGRLWCWEGCSDDSGCCTGSCTHVWNYAQAIPHLFADLERTFRQTEFNESQNAQGHQQFRSSLPIRSSTHDFHAAADGQLGGIMKVYRDWRISGDRQWLQRLWPKVRASLDFCIGNWDPRGVGVLEEPHHNTYDIEYWGPDGHCSSFYLGALTAAIEMGRTLGEDVARYDELRRKGRAYLETKLYNGEYFFQEVRTKGLNATFQPLATTGSGPAYQELTAQINEQGPKYQYGAGCLSDGVLGFWMARVCGLDQEIVDTAKINSNLRAIYQYNLKHDLSEHSNTQRPTYALGDEGGLLLCTWPRGGKPYLPFVYSDEVWTGIEYSAASYMILQGLVNEGLDVVRTCRLRYDGRTRNPFNEYECGHWYARAFSSYALLYALTGVRYDAVNKTLYIDSKVGPDFKSFLSTATGYGSAGLQAGKPFVEVKKGFIDIEKVLISGQQATIIP